MQGAVVKFRRLGLTSSVAEAQSHDEGVGGRSLTEIHESVKGIQSNSVTGVSKHDWAQQCNGSMPSWFTGMYGVFLGIGS